MKLGIFTDSHYSSAELTCGKRYNNKSLGKIREAMEYFQREQVELVVCLGDLIDHESCHKKEIENLREVGKVIEKYSFSTYVLMGNHDGFSFEKEEFYDILGKRCRPPRALIKDGKTLVFYDSCYFKNGKHYMPGDTDWTDCFLPRPDLISEFVKKAPGELFVFLHHNLDPEIREDHRVFNCDEVRKIFEESGKVKTVFQGHYHEGHKSVHGGVNYITLPAMCENEKAYFTIEI